MMRYGNMVCSHSANPPLVYTHYQDRDPGKALRNVGPYNNETNDQVMAMWGNFVRTGRRGQFARRPPFQLRRFLRKNFYTRVNAECGLNPDQMHIPVHSLNHRSGLQDSTKQGVIKGFLAERSGSIAP